MLAPPSRGRAAYRLKIRSADRASRKEVSNNDRRAPAGCTGQLSLRLRGYREWPASPRPRSARTAGQLDTLYCDENNDLVADAPKDPKKWKDPATLVFAYTPVEDPAVYQNIFKPFTDYLDQCTGKRVVYYPVQSNSAEIEAMRSGRLHVAGFSTGPTGFAVNLAGAVPFAAKGTEKGPHGYHLISHRQERQPLPEALRPQGQARRAYRAVVEFRPSCAARALSARRPQAERGLQAADVGRTRQVGARRAVRRLRHGRRRLRRLRAHGDARHHQGRRLPHHLSRARCSRPRRSPMRTTSSPTSPRRSRRLLLRLPLPARDAEGIQRRRPLLPDHLQGHLEGGARDRGRLRHALQQGGLRRGSQARGRGAGQEGSNSSSSQPPKQ